MLKEYVFLLVMAFGVCEFWYLLCLLLCIDASKFNQIVLEADGYQPYLISPEKGLRSLIKGVLELAKESSRLCVDEVNKFWFFYLYVYCACSGLY